MFFSVKVEEHHFIYSQPILDDGPLNVGVSPTRNVFLPPSIDAALDGDSLAQPTFSFTNTMNLCRSKNYSRTPPKCSTKGREMFMMGTWCDASRSCSDSMQAIWLESSSE